MSTQILWVILVESLIVVAWYVLQEHIPDFQGTEKGSASSDGSAGAFPQNRKPVKTW